MGYERITRVNDYCAYNSGRQRVMIIENDINIMLGDVSVNATQCMSNHQLPPGILSLFILPNSDVNSVLIHWLATLCFAEKFLIHEVGIITTSLNRIIVCFY